MTYPIITEELLKQLVTDAEINSDGRVASYIPELANVDENMTAIAVKPIGSPAVVYSNVPLIPITLQSTAKLIPLIGLLENFGVEQILKWVKVEPSGDDFSSITRLEQFGPLPSNPMLNSGAIMLCSHVPGKNEQLFSWIEEWVHRLFNHPIGINPSVLASEKRTGDRNRSIAYILHSRGLLGASVDATLDLYFALCSYQATIDKTVYLPALLANLGKDPDTGEQIISPETCKITLSIMATCGLYNETGTHMVRTGMPAKSGVSGYVFASVPQKAGISVLSPRVNQKGNSIRGELLLESLSKTMNWHFAS